MLKNDEFLMTDRNLNRFAGKYKLIYLPILTMLPIDCIIKNNDHVRSILKRLKSINNIEITS